MDRARRLVGTPYGDSVLILYEGGRLGCYKYVPRSRDDVTSIRGNRLHVRFRAAGAKRVNLAGTFNGWDPAGAPLKTEDGELWQLALDLESGRTEYKVVVDGRRWELDPHVPFVPGAYGPNNYVDLPCNVAALELLGS